MKVKAILIVTIMVLSILPYTNEGTLKSETISSTDSSSADVAVTQLDVTTPSVYVGGCPNSISNEPHYSSNYCKFRRN